MEVELFKPHIGQKTIMDSILEGKEKWHVVVTGRQFGKTLMAENLMLYLLLTNQNKTGVWISPYNRQAESVYADLVQHAEKLIERKNGSNKTIHFKSGSVLKFASADNYDSIRGDKYDYGVIDEAAFVKSAAEPVIRPIFAVKGKKVIIISTPRGKGHWFHKYYERGLSSDKKYKSYVSYHAKSLDNPYFPEEEYWEAVDEYPQEIVDSEYNAHFLDDGGEVFSNFTELCIVERYKSSTKDPCYLGCDLSIGGKDKTVVCIMDSEGNIVSFQSWREGITSEQILKLTEVVHNYNIVGGYIETNTERGIQQSITGINPLIQGFHTNIKSKADAIHNLKKDIEDRSITLPTPRLEPDLYSELSSYTKTIKQNGISYHHVEGGHDDYVDALWLANEARAGKRYSGHKPRTNSFIKR